LAHLYEQFTFATPRRRPCGAIRLICAGVRVGNT
jgi:hypothetical protein